MKVLLIVGGVLFLLVAAALLAGAVVLFVIARRRRTPDAAPAIVSAPHAPAAAAKPLPPPQPSAPFDPLATMVVTARPEGRGALHAVSGPLAGRAFPIDVAGFFIGRDPLVSQVVVDSPDVSKRHVWVGLRDDVVVAADQQSTNGTFLNAPGAAIREIRLKPGDTIILANDAARFTYKLD